MKVAWSHCVLKVRDMEQMAGFYCDALGFQVSDRGTVGADTEIVFLSGSSSDHHQLGLMSGRTEDDGGSLDHNAFRVETLADVKAMIEWVENDDRTGGAFPVTHGNAVSVYFSDPEGNGIEIFCDTPWHVKQPVVNRWDPNQSDEDVLAQIKEQFEKTPGFMDMERYRSVQAAAFGEAG